MADNSREVFIVVASNTLANNLLNENEALLSSIQVDRKVALVYIAACLFADGLMSLGERQHATLDLGKIDIVLDQHMPGGNAVLKDYMGFLKEVGEQKLGELYSVIGEDAARRYCISLYLHGKLGLNEKDYSQEKLEESLVERCFPGVEQFFEKLGSDDWEHAMNPL